jgi:DNA adenine methylase
MRISKTDSKNIGRPFLRGRPIPHEEERSTMGFEKYSHVCVAPYFGAKADSEVQKAYRLFMPKQGVDTFVDAYGGMGNIVLNIRTFFGEGTKKVYNELTAELIAVFRCLKDPEKAKKFRRLMLETESEISSDKFFETKARWDNYYEALSAKTEQERQAVARELFGSDVDMAVSAYTYILLSRNGDMSSFKTQLIREIRARVRDKAYTMLEVTRALKDIEIENQDAIDIINQYKDQESAMLFLDPPYPPDTRNPSSRKKKACKSEEDDGKKLRTYRHEMSNAEHQRLLEAILDARAKVMICSYDKGNELYNDMLTKAAGWKKIHVCERYCNADVSFRRHVKSMRDEYVWVNYDYNWKTK